jgi:predicted dinucleotide-binding enzyme
MDAAAGEPEARAVKIGILGSGAVARTLGTGFLKYGHEVTVGTRDAAKLAEWKAANPKGSVGSFADAAAFGEVLVLAAKGSVAAKVCRLAGAGNFAGKPVLDTTNPIVEGGPDKGVLKYFTTLEDSLMERLQKEFPEARFVKAFNSVGAPRMVDPDFGGVKPTMFLCGNDAAAKATATKILDQFGWEVADMGGVEAARAIEPLCILWCIPGFRENSWTHAFKLLK